MHVEDRAGRCQGPPSSVGSTPLLTLRECHTRPAHRFICNRLDSHVQRYLRSSHTTTIVTTAGVWFRFYQLYNIWPSSSSSLAKNFTFNFLIKFLIIIANLYTSICQRLGWVKPSSGNKIIQRKLEFLHILHTG